MFFRKKKGEDARPEPPLPQPPAAAAPSPAPPAPGAEAGGSGGAPARAAGPAEGGTTQFLTGDQLTDRRTVQVLLEAIASLSEAQDLDELLNKIVDRSIEVTGAERGLLLLRGAGGELETRVARQRGGKTLSGELRFSTTVAGRVLDQLQPVRATVHTDSEAMNLGQSVYDLKLRAVMCVPLTTQESATPEAAAAAKGVLYVDSRAATRQFSQRDLGLFAALAQHIAIALEKAQLHVESMEKTRLEETLRVARDIQRDLIAPLPRDIAGYDLYAWYSPAEKAAGDFYDFVKLRDGRFGVVVGDVTGHGIGPALISATAQASLRSSLRLVPRSGDAVTLLNQDLCERIQDGRFLTLFLGLLDREGGLEALNAGHAEPLLWRAATRSVERLNRGGPALGMMAEATYEPTDHLKLAPGDVLLVFSDGLPEAKAAADPDLFFGEDGLRAALVELAAGGGSAEQIAMGIVARVLAFCGQKLEDDMSVLVVRRTS